MANKYFCWLSLHSKKKVGEFPVPSRDVTTKLSLGGNNDVITEFFLPWGSLFCDIPSGDGKLVNLFLRCTHNLCLNRCSLAVSTERLRNLKILPRNLNEIVHSWIWLLCRFVLTFPASSFGCAAKQIKRLVCTSIWVMALHYLFIYNL